MDPQEIRQIRICFISLRAYPLFNSQVHANFGGAEVDLYHIATELAKDPDYDVHMVVGDYGQPQIEKIEDVTLHKSLDVNKNLFMQASRIWSALRRADAEIYMTKLLSLATVLFALFCKINKRVFLYRTAHTHECDGTYFKENPLRALAVRWALRQANTIWTQNETDSGYLKQTMDLPSIHIRNAHRLPSDELQPRKFILWVGRFVAMKRPEKYLEMARAYPELQFKMVCQAPPDAQGFEAFKNEASQIPNLTLLPFLPYQQMEETFKQAALFVSTSVAEGFPNTFIQACKYRVPILSLKVNPDQFLDKNNCGFCAKDDWDLFCRLFKELLDEKRCCELGQNGLQYVDAYHNIEKIIEQYKVNFKQYV